MLPVQWRKHLALDVDAVAAACAPSGSATIRGTMHATAVEVLLYLAPAHAADMIKSLVASLNAQWRRFSARHPDFEGQVHVVAHSLGSLLVYDVLCQQPGAMRRLAERGVTVGRGVVVVEGGGGGRGGGGGGGGGGGAGAAAGAAGAPAAASSSPPSSLEDLHSHPIASAASGEAECERGDGGGGGGDGDEGDDGDDEEKRRLRAENEALRRRLSQLQQEQQQQQRGQQLQQRYVPSSSSPSTAAVAAAAGEPGGDVSGAAAAMASVPALDFDVDQFVCVGERILFLFFLGFLFLCVCVFFVCVCLRVCPLAVPSYSIALSSFPRSKIYDIIKQMRFHDNCGEFARKESREIFFFVRFFFQKKTKQKNATLVNSVANPHQHQSKTLAHFFFTQTLTGSPLGLFLALRQVNPNAGRGLGTPGAAALMPGAWSLMMAERATDDEEVDDNAAAAAAAKNKPKPAKKESKESVVYYDGLPACRRLYNLYHPYDPIAYRIEPLAAPFAVALQQQACRM